MEADPGHVARLYDFGQKNDVGSFDEIVVVGLEDDLCTALNSHEIAEILAGIRAVR